MNPGNNHAFQRASFRLTAGYVGVLAAILLAFGTMLVLGFWHQQQSKQDALLVNVARDVTGGIPPGYDSAPQVPELEPEVAIFSVSFDGSLSIGRASGSSLGLPRKDAATEAFEQQEALAKTVTGTSGAVRVMSVPIAQNGRIVAVVQAGQSADQVRGIVWRLGLMLVPIGVGALILAAAGGFLVSRRAMRPVEDSFERQRVFVANASHELKTPLTLIRADAEVLARGSMPPEDLELIEDLLEETDRMSDLLSELLLLARLDAGNLTVAREPFDLLTVVFNATDRFRVRADEADVRLEVEGHANILALGDAERAEQILSAILDNALRFTPAKGKIAVSARTADGKVEVSVEDEGPGIPKKHLLHVFDRFYQVEEARNRKSGSTGLGLSIARDLARAQGGDLTASSPPSGGARLSLTLPLHEGSIPRKSGAGLSKES